MPQWNGRTTFERRRNWWSFYCRDFQNNRVADCASYAGSSMRCFSAWDSNWSLNAVLVDECEHWRKSGLIKEDGPMAGSGLQVPVPSGLRRGDVAEAGRV